MSAGPLHGCATRVQHFLSVRASISPSSTCARMIFHLFQTTNLCYICMVCFLGGGACDRLMWFMRCYANNVYIQHVNMYWTCPKKYAMRKQVSTQVLYVTSNTRFDASNYMQQYFCRYYVSWPYITHANNVHMMPVTYELRQNLPQELLWESNNSNVWSTSNIWCKQLQ